VGQAQLFLDDGIIEHSTLLKRFVHQPVRSPLNPVCKPEAPYTNVTGPCRGYRVLMAGSPSPA
jgi:hypothetical protein